MATQLLDGRLALVTGAGQGNGRAQVFLGRMYYLGEGVPRDYVKSYAWLTLAEPQEPESAGYFLKKLRSAMSSAEIDKAKELAQSYRPSS